MAFNRIGYGQVEENQMSYYHTGQMFASLPLDPTVQVLQNGEFMWYDYADNMVTAAPVKGSTEVEPMIVLNEIKIYEDYLANKDFAMIRVGDNYTTNPAAIGRITTAPVDGKSTYQDGSLTVGVNADPAHTEYGYRMDGIAPRLCKTNIGDIYTTNMVYAESDYELGTILGLKKVDTVVTPVGATATVTQSTLQLCPEADADYKMIKFQVVKDYTMPDGQRGLKVQRIQ